MKAEEFHKMCVPLRDRLLQQALRLSAHDVDTAEDLVQETLLRLWELREELDKHPNVEALASVILRNKWNDYWRRSQHTLNNEQLLQQLEDGATEPSADMELIDLIVSHLPPLQQQIFRMKEIEGCEKEQIMLATGCSDESLRQNLSRARRRIRKLFIMSMATGIAALLLIGGGITALHLRSSNDGQQQDYAVLDGHYTTDDAIIAREAEEALLMVSATDEDTFDAIDIFATP